MNSLIKLGLLNWILLICYIDHLVHSHWTGHYRYQKRQLRPKRQFNNGNGPAQIDLNITVPFIFSARLYPYGEDKGDHILEAYSKTQVYVTKHELRFLEENVTVLHISRDGAIGFGQSLDDISPGPFPNVAKMLAVYWTSVSLGDTGRVYFRETEDENVLSLAASEIQIQYHYGAEFKPKSVFIVTWENMAPADAPNDLPNSNRNTFQLALILSNNGTFAHIIYSKLKWHNNAIAGFNYGNAGRQYFNIPGSGSANALRLANDSDIGIPGEWLFKIDTSNVHLCGPGFKGLECITRCDKGEFSYDCQRHCHCSTGTCNVVNGVCPNLECAPGWTNAPYCDLDDDECSKGNPCQLDKLNPNCVNTMGSFVCTCLAGYDEKTGFCLPYHSPTEKIPSRLDLVPIDPSPRVLTPVLAKKPDSASPVSVVVHPKLSVNIPESIKSHSPSSSTLVTRTYPAIKSTTSTTAAPTTQQFTTVEDIRTPGLETTIDLVETTPAVPVLPPNIPYLSTSTPQSLTSSRPPRCDLRCGDHARCELAQNKPRCVCTKGWSGDGQYCVDINECFLENACNGNARCQNTPGSYTCLCEAGFKSNGKECVDIDECKDGLVQCPGGNTSHGSYECRCRAGYNGNPVSVLGCIDINECLIPEFYCGPNAECENFIGSFTCTCHDGYEKNEKTNECEDIDECLKAPCSRAAACHNTAGSFVCSCLEGYTGDGFLCEETILYPFNRVEDQRLPQQKNANMELALSRPVKILGKVYDRIYISANGMISFDEPTKTYSELTLREMRRVALVPFYQRADLTKGGSVYAKETTDYSSLVRASLSVQEDFHETTFQAKSIVVVTFEDVMDVITTEDSKRNTFQAVIANGDASTYVSFIYDRVTNPLGQMGIVAPEPPRSVVAPASGINATLLKETSNIGIPGKWIFRVDQKQIIQCPSGLLGPPYCLADCEAGFWGQNCQEVCHCADGVPCDFKTGYCSNHVCTVGYTGDNCYSDLDECTTRQHRCHYQAYCINTIGSYECKCYAGYQGDGYHCFETNACYLYHGVSCGLNASCVVSLNIRALNDSTAECICDQGFIGDGFNCTSIVSNETTTNTTRTTSIITLDIVTNSTFESIFPPLQTQSIDEIQSIIFEDPKYAHTLNLSSNNHRIYYPSTTSIPFDISTSSGTLTTLQANSSLEVAVTVSSLATAITVSSLATTTTVSTQSMDSSRENETIIETPLLGIELPVFNLGDIPSTESTPNVVDSTLDDRTTKEMANVESTQFTNAVQSNVDNLASASSSNVSSTSNMLVILVPTVLCGVWLILIIILIAVCMRKKKHHRMDKYGVGYYYPSGINSKDSTLTTGSYAAYGSHWTIPRPVYDYSQGIYYPADGYAAYKY